ncbi:hypothetical protein [Brevundimonas sp. RM1]
MTQTSSSSRRVDTYTAVVFVHGMGPQGRHENLGQLLEALEDSCDEDDGALRRFKARTEPSRAGDGDDQPFMQFDRFEPVFDAWGNTMRWRVQGRYRAYEAYWSPVTARGASARRVALWAIGRLTKPTEIAGRSWREATRLRIARLHRLRVERSRPSDPDEARRQDYVDASLLSAIQRFRGAEGARFERRNPRRAMDDKAFTEFATKKLGHHWGEPIAATVQAWNDIRLPVENLAADLTRHFYRMGLPALLLMTALSVQVMTTGARDIWAIGGLALQLIALSLVACFGSKFLSETFSDVFIWNNTDDRDLEFHRRQEILNKTRNLFEHITCDPACKRVVIVAHSLGTAITLETLSVIGRRNEARQDRKTYVKLNKISHLFTLGSPIDKIFYFFRTREGQSYRAGRLADDLFGNLSQEPFFWNGRQRFRWLNIFDRVDIVSDPLFTPLGDQTDGADIRTAEIENYVVENTKSLDPIKSHIAYLSNDDVVASVGAALFHNRTESPVSYSRSSRVSATATLRALKRMIVWLPATLILAAILVASGNSAIGLVVTFAPCAVLAVEVLISKVVRLAPYQWRRFKSLVSRAMLKVRTLVAAPRGD